MSSDASLPLLEPSSSKPTKRSTLLTVTPFILGNEFCERLAFYGLASNLVTYLYDVMGVDRGMAAMQVSVFEGLCFTTPLIGAFLADSYWGRYKTILVFSCIYLAGLVMLTASAGVPGFTPGPDEDANWGQSAMLAAALATIALGTGGIKPNVSAFGADQFNVLDPQDAAEKQSFFGFFYMAINIGSFIACTAIVYVQDSISWTLGFAIPGVAMFLGVVLFVAGRGRYRHVHPTESPMSRVAKVVYAAIQNRWKKLRSGGAEAGEVAPDVSSLHGAQQYGGRRDMGANGAALPYGTPHQSGQAGQHIAAPPGSNGAGLGGGSLRRSKPGYTPTGGEERGSNEYDRIHAVPNTASMSYRWLEDAITEWQTSQGHLMHVGGGLAGYTPQQVEEVKLVLRLLPVFWTTVFYWCIYTQMGAMFVQQGSVMQHDYVIQGYTLHFPSASMSLFNTLAIILLIPFYDRVFEPLLQRCSHKITMLQRMGVGMVICVVAMLAAAGVEWWRLKLALAASDGGTPDSPLGLGRPPALSSELNIFWQVPQYFLIGMSEIFTSIGMLEFFYDQAPDVMRSCSMALCLLSSAIGSYMSALLVWAVQYITTVWFDEAWLPQDLNRGHLDWYFCLLAGIMLLNFGVFVLVARGFEYKLVEHPRLDISRAHSLITDQAGNGEPRIEGRAQSVLSPLPSRPPRYPSRSVTAPVGIGGRRNMSAPPENDSATEDLLYGRSLAYFPESPALPPNYR